MPLANVLDIDSLVSPVSEFSTFGRVDNGELLFDELTIFSSGALLEIKLQRDSDNQPTGIELFRNLTDRKQSFRYSWDQIQDLSRLRIIGSSEGVELNSPFEAEDLEKLNGIVDIDADLFVELNQLKSIVVDSESTNAASLVYAPEGKCFDGNARTCPVVVVEFGAYRHLLAWAEDYREGLWGRKPIKAIPENYSWDKLIKDCQLLLKISKDVRVTAILSVAASHRYGLAGLRDGLVLLKRMLERFGSSLHPQPKRAEGPVDQRRQLATAFRPLQALPRFLEDAAALAPLTTDEEKRVCLLRFQIAQYLRENGKSLVPEQKAHFEATALSQTSIAQLICEDGHDHIQSCIDTLKESMALCQDVSQAIKSLLEDPAAVKESSSSDDHYGVLQKRLQECLSIMQPCLETTKSQSSKTKAPPGRDPTPSPTSTETQGGVNEARGREQAVLYMEKAKEYFERFEPHSPIPFLLKRALNWGGMSLDHIMAEILADQPTALKMLSDRANMSPSGVSKVEVPTVAPTPSNPTSPITPAPSNPKQEEDPFG